ncbi:MAG: hypothetical protein ACE5EA_07150 [Nitrospirota bacterium]
MIRKSIGLRFIGLLLSIMMVSVIFFNQEASAVPAFARQQGISCSSCHTNWPQLNSFGRSFKESGYRLNEENLQISDYLTLNKNIPVSARLNMRIIDRKTSAKLNLRAFHEAEVFFAGKAGDKFSFFAEMASEDEFAPAEEPGDGVNDPQGVPGFQVQVVSGVVSYHHNRYANLYFGLGSPFYPDGYNTLHHHNASRKDWVPLTKGFIPGESQFVSLSGRPVDELFYIVGVSADNANSSRLEGNDAQDYSLRLAYDLLPDITLGAFYNAGKIFDSDKGESTDNKLFSRRGIDLNANVDSINIDALYAIARDIDDNNDGIVDGLINDYIFSVEVHYFLEKDGRPWLSPSLIYDRYTMNDGRDDWAEGGLFITYFARDNIKTQIGWEGTFDDPSGDNSGRYSLVVDVGF